MFDNVFKLKLQQFYKFPFNWNVFYDLDLNSIKYPISVKSCNEILMFRNSVLCSHVVSRPVPDKMNAFWNFFSQKKKKKIMAINFIDCCTLTTIKQKCVVTFNCQFAWKYICITKTSFSKHFSQKYIIFPFRQIYLYAYHIK